MVPDISVRLQAMLRAMTEVIVPAIVPDSKIALEQAYLVIAFLKLIGLQYDKVLRYELTELREFSGLIASLIDVAEGGAATEAMVTEARSHVHRVAPLIALQIPHQDDVVSMVRQLREGADKLVRAAYQDGTASFQAAATALVLTQGAKEISRTRAWVAPLGMDPDPASLRAIDEVLSQADD